MYRNRLAMIGMQEMDYFCLSMAGHQVAVQVRSILQTPDLSL